jgi:hypothetical protein
VLHAKHTLLASKQADEQYARAVHCEQGSYGVEFGRENLEHDQAERKLSDRSTYVCAFKCSLRRSDLDQLGAGENN